MIATVTAQHAHGTSSGLNIRYMRDSNLAGAPLLVPKRTARSNTPPTPQSISRQGPSTPRSYSIPNQGDSDSDSGSASTPAYKSAARPRRRRVRAQLLGDLPPSSNSASFSLSSEAPTVPTGRLPQLRTLQGEDLKLERSEATIVAPRPLMYAPGALRLSVETIRSHLFPQPPLLDSRSSPGSGSKSAPPPDGHRSEVGGSPPVIRKKSGQLVKSSLRTPRLSTRGNLSIITIGSSSKSEPPTPKAVHFDAKLEHVKLFLAEQKPLAVSRDGSPTDDTSGTDSDFPSYIYGENDSTRQSRSKLVMRSINIPSRGTPEADVALEDFYLNFDGTSILGKVRVRNIAFAKSVTARFTFDSWQTTSEVTGQYAESINSQFDRFSFSIRLNDLLARIEGKTLVMAIRYNVAGKEFWDNNHQQNYVATFTKAKMVLGGKKSDDEDASDVENLRNRLEKVILHDEENGNALPCTTKKFAMSRSKETDPPSFKSNVSFSSRYDFTTSLREPAAWKVSNAVIRGSPPPIDALVPPQPAEDLMFPAPPSSIPFPEKTTSTQRPSALPALGSSSEEPPCLGSPRDISEPLPLSSLPPFCRRSNDDTKGSLSPSVIPSRNHRRSYSDTGSLHVNSSVKMTSPGTPPSRPLELTASSSQPTPPRYYSFPPLMPSGTSFAPPSSLGFEFTNPIAIPQLPSASPSSSIFHGFKPALAESSGESELSTSSLTTPTSSPSPAPSPTSIFIDGVALPSLDGDAFNLDSDFGLAQHLPPASPGTHYKQFLNKFCFFTGA